MINVEAIDSWLWDDKPYSKAQAWIDLIMLANEDDIHEYRNGKMVTYKRGEVHTSTVSLAERWGWSRRKVKNFICALECTGNVTAKGTAKGTTVTIENYTSMRIQCTAKGTAKGTTDVTAKGTTEHSKTAENIEITTDRGGFTEEPQSRERENERKEKERTKEKENKEKEKEIFSKEKNIKKESLQDITAMLPVELQEPVTEFAKMRTAIGKPLTPYGLGKLLQQARRLARGDICKMIKILDQSTANSWQGVFELKDERSENPFLDLLENEQRRNLKDYERLI